MNRHLESSVWLVSALLAVAFFFVAGFYGWAAIILWSVWYHLSW